MVQSQEEVDHSDALILGQAQKTQLNLFTQAPNDPHLNDTFYDNDINLDNINFNGDFDDDEALQIALNMSKEDAKRKSDECQADLVNLSDEEIDLANFNNIIRENDNDGNNDVNITEIITGENSMSEDEPDVQKFFLFGENRTGKLMKMSL